jgi:hypothetical protein
LRDKGNTKVCERETSFIETSITKNYLLQAITNPSKKEEEDLLAFISNLVVLPKVISCLNIDWTEILSP